MAVWFSQVKFLAERYIQMKYIDSNTSSIKIAVFLCVALLPLASTLQAGQNKDAPVLGAGTTEVGGFIGESYGLDSWRVMGGGNVSYAVTKYLMPYVEFSHFPGISRQLTSGTATATYEVPLNDFHGGVHIRIPLGQSKIVPYGVAGAGVIHSGDAPVRITFADGTVLPATVKGSNDFAANFGGGLRYYTTERLGFRVEGKIYKPTGNYTGTFSKVEFGVFFQFGKPRNKN